MTESAVQVRPVMLVVSLVGLMIVSPVFGATTGVKNEWNLTLQGDHESIITQSEFETGMDYHKQNHHFASVVDTEGKVWDGMPLWELAGNVNEENDNKINTVNQSACNDAEDQKNYTVTVTGSDGSELTMKGEDIFRNNNYIVANTVNGNPLTSTDSAYPLVLIGRDLPQDQIIRGVSVISLNLS